MSNSGSLPEAEIRNAILKLAADRGPQKSICPSEVAHAMDADSWRDLMDLVRTQGLYLEKQGRIDVLQKGCRVDGSIAKGPIRYRIVSEPSQLD